MVMMAVLLAELQFCNFDWLCTVLSKLYETNLLLVVASKQVIISNFCTYIFTWLILNKSSTVGCCFLTQNQYWAPYLKLIEDTFMTEVCRILSCDSVVPTTENSTDIVEIKRPAALNVVLLVGFGYTETLLQSR